MTERMSLSQVLQRDMETARRMLDTWRYDEGLAIIARYPRLSENDPFVMMLHGTFLLRKAEYGAAADLFRKVLTLGRGQPETIPYLAMCLANLDRREEALKLLETERALDPHNRIILEQLLSLTLSMRGGEAAMQVLAAETRSGRNDTALAPAIETLRQKALGMYSPEEIASWDQGDLLGLRTLPAPGYNLRSIYGMFEPLGLNCEFGFAQRRHKTEPLSLFRWTSIAPDDLIRLLSCGLDGFEDPSIYSLDGASEYILRDSRFGTRSHTGVHRSDLAEADFLDRIVRRQAFLKRKFMEDARADQKVFVYKFDGIIDAGMSSEIGYRLRQLGVSRCLFVHRMLPGVPSGTVRFDTSFTAHASLSDVMPNFHYDEWDRLVVAVFDNWLKA